MPTYEFDVVPVDQNGSKAFNDDVKAWQSIETFLDARGVLGWELVSTLDNTRPRCLVLSKEAIGTLFAGSITAGVVATALIPDQDIVEIILQADPSNSSNLYVGDATTQTFKLSSGANIKISIDSISKIYVRGNGQVANWIATGR